jgi:hypothetical protein
MIPIPCEFPFTSGAPGRARTTSWSDTFHVRKALLQAASPDPVPRAQRLSSRA